MTTDLISIERKLLANVTKTPRLFTDIVKEACIKSGSDWGNKWVKKDWRDGMNDLIEKVGLNRSWDEQGNTLVSK